MQENGQRAILQRAGLGRPKLLLSARSLFQERPPARLLPGAPCQAGLSSPSAVCLARTWANRYLLTNSPASTLQRHTQLPWLRTPNERDLRGVSQPKSSRASIWSQVPLRPKCRELNVMDENLGSGARVSGLGFSCVTDLLMKEMGAPPDPKNKVTTTHEEQPTTPPGGIKNTHFKVRPTWV